MFTEFRANSVEDAVRRGQRQVREDKMKQALQMDDKTFQAILLDSQVMTARDPSKWNFEVLQELIEGPLLNSKRMEEAIRVSRYMRKLISFFHPFSHKFSDMPKTKVRVPYMRGLLALTRSCAGEHTLGPPGMPVVDRSLAIFGRCQVPGGRRSLEPDSAEFRSA